MRLVPDDDQVALVASVRSTMASWANDDDAPASRGGPLVRRRSEAASQGWFSLSVPEHHDGLGLGLVEEALVVAEVARAAPPAPLVASLLAAHVCSTQGADDLLSSVISGARPVGLLVGIDHALAATEGGLLLERVGAGLRLLDATSVREVAGTDDQEAVSRVERGRTLLTTDDPLLGARWDVLLAAALIGIADVARDESVEHAGLREQFGKPIGSFQAVKHRCADMAVRAYTARCQLYLATTSVEEPGPDAAFHAAAALLLAADAARANAAANVQNHGAIGFSSEHSAERHVKRAATLCAAGDLRGRTSGIVLDRRPRQLG